MRYVRSVSMWWARWTTDVWRPGIYIYRHTSTFLHLFDNTRICLCSDTCIYICLVPITCPICRKDIRGPTGQVLIIPYALVDLIGVIQQQQRPPPPHPDVIVIDDNNEEDSNRVEKNPPKSHQEMAWAGLMTQFVTSATPMWKFDSDQCLSLYPTEKKRCSVSENTGSTRSSGTFQVISTRSKHKCMFIYIFFLLMGTFVLVVNTGIPDRISCRGGLNVKGKRMMRCLEYELQRKDLLPRLVRLLRSCHYVTYIEMISRVYLDVFLSTKCQCVFFPFPNPPST